MTNQALLELDGLITTLNYTITQLSGFVSQFNDIQMAHAVKVITDPMGNMFLDVPASMPESLEKTLTTKLGIIDRLCNTHGQSISDLLHKGNLLEQQLKLENPNYTTKLSSQIAEFARLKGAFNH
jgi:hypothetical protein